MPYAVWDEKDTRKQGGLQEFCNFMESEGWTLVHIRPGHRTSYLGYTRTHYIFHKP